MLMMALESLESSSKYIIKYLTRSNKSCILAKLNDDVELIIIEIWKEQYLQAICIQDWIDTRFLIFKRMD
jgi:hypothetical protein